MDDCEGSCGSAEYQRLIRVRDAQAAERLCAVLEGEGIPVIPSAANGAAPVGAGAQGEPEVDLYVSADRLLEAQVLLAERSPAGKV